MSPCRQLSIAAVFALAAACASLEAPFSGHLASDAQERRACAEWFQNLDARVEAAGVRDAQETRVAGFPYLRVSRLLAALRPAAASEEAVQALADRMLALDLESRRFEIMNLPAGQAGGVPESVARAVLRAAPARARPGESGRAPCAARARAGAGRLHPAASHLRLVCAHLICVCGRSQALRGANARGVPAGSFRAGRRGRDPLRAAARAAAVEGSRGNDPGARGDESARYPEVGEGELAELFAAYAPSFEIAVAGDYDLFGALRWLRDGETPMVDASDLAVYTQTAWTRYRDRVLLQLVYTIWFAERPEREAGDILAGRLDGITWRVTLAPDGEPLIYDAVHPCGCYHLFFPTPRAQALPAPSAAEEWMFSPQTLPPIAEGERPILRIASGTHYIERVALVRGSDSLARYELRPYGELRSMQRLGPGRASAFGPDGLVRGTQRPERYLFWPTGIDSAGAMRQWGRQATAFVGRRHFDDADLLEKRFRLELR